MKEYYFPVVKFISVLFLIAYFVVSNREWSRETGMELFLLACLLSVSMYYEVAKNNRLFILLAEVSLLLVLLFLYGTYCILLLPIVFLDGLTFFTAPLASYFLPLLVAAFDLDSAFTYASFCLFIIILYIQHHVIIKEYRTYLDDFEQQESRLKRSLDHKDVFLQNKLKQNSLHFENHILAEKARLSQSLHDKLGHSINGSIYQLEACKVLSEREPAEIQRRIDQVILSLRESMDEIRAILRNEKPDKKQMALLQLTELCENCRQKYGIHAEVILEDSISYDPTQIKASIWEVILDNTFEAVSNALKYAQCQNIRIHIMIHNQFIRCHISDDGIGCGEIVEGMGLQGMKQRTRELGGTLSVESLDGFSLNMILPFEF